MFIFFLKTIKVFFFFFFFSSRRRHTRWNCDWSSDVCSSDLAPAPPPGPPAPTWCASSAAAPDSPAAAAPATPRGWPAPTACAARAVGRDSPRSEEHTSELQSQFHLVCRLLLEKKKNNKIMK